MTTTTQTLTEYAVRTNNNQETYNNIDEATQTFNELKNNPEPDMRLIELIKYSRDNKHEDWEETILTVTYVNDDE